METNQTKVTEIEVGDHVYFNGHTAEEVIKITPYGNSFHSLLFYTERNGYHAVKNEKLKTK